MRWSSAIIHWPHVETHHSGTVISSRYDLRHIVIVQVRCILDLKHVRIMMRARVMGRR